MCTVRLHSKWYGICNVVCTVSWCEWYGFRNITCTVFRCEWYGVLHSMFTGSQCEWYGILNTVLFWRTILLLAFVPLWNFHLLYNDSLCCCWSLLYSAILHSRVDWVRFCCMWFWMTDLPLITRFEYPLKWCTYSAVWSLRGWCHVKLLPSRRTFCDHHTTMHRVTSLHAGPRT